MRERRDGIGLDTRVGGQKLVGMHVGDEVAKAVFICDAFENGIAIENAGEKEGEEGM